MASHIGNVLKLRNDLKMLQVLDDSLLICKRESRIGINMSTTGYTLMDIVHRWVKTERRLLKEQHDQLTNIKIIQYQARFCFDIFPQVIW